jgi:hypothetical protein
MQLDSMMLLRWREVQPGIMELGASSSWSSRPQRPPRLYLAPIGGAADEEASGWETMRADGFSDAMKEEVAPAWLQGGQPTNRQGCCRCSVRHSGFDEQRPYGVTRRAKRRPAGRAAGAQQARAPGFIGTQGKTEARL